MYSHHVFKCSDIKMTKFLTLVGLLICVVSGICCCEISFDEKDEYHPTREESGFMGRDYEVVVPRKVSAEGKFLSHQIPHHFKRFHYKENENPSANDAVHYRLKIEGVEHHLELYPNHRLLSPGAVLEKRQTSTLKKPLADVELKRIRDTQCHYQGKAGNQREKSALSTCYGLAGYIRTDREWYMIEPVAGYDFTKNSEHPHIVYRSRPNGIKLVKNRCNVTENTSRRITKRSMKSSKPGSFKIEENKPYILETLVVLSKALLDHYKDFDMENYVLTLLNMAAGLFRDASLGLEIELVVVRIMRLEVEESELNLSVNKDAESTLEHFQQWQKLMNPGDDKHPNHHDCAILLTNIDICLNTKLCGFTGISTIASTCDSEKSGIIIKDNGLQTGYNIAHHIGHSLGMSHDVEEENGCPGIYRSKNGYVETTVMYPGSHYVTKRWSECSRSYIRQYIEAGLGACLLDNPGDHQFSSMEMLPGVMYNADDQCRLRYRADVHQCDANCKKLMCVVPDRGCISEDKPLADGTSCGERKWCYETECLTIGEKLSTVANWGTWSPWSRCSRTCGSGVASSTRNCNHKGSKDAEYCRGNSKRHRICATEPCEIGSPSFRDVQCAEFNDWTFPEDGKVHQWVGYNLPENLKASENPCILYCLSETNLLTSLRSKVIDGTTCYRGIRDICVNGNCEEIPCDLNMESDAVEDRCGVCRGDSTSCLLKEGTIFASAHSHLKRIVEAPAGSKNIRVEELAPTKSRIIIQSKKTKTVLIDGSRLGMFDVPGSKAWLGMIRASQEALNIPGPITESLEILVLPRENVTLKYSIGVKPDVRRKPVFSWDFIEWSHCNSPCGPGEEIARPKCIEKIGGLVDDRHCKNLNKPDPKMRVCNQAPCIPRWLIGEWRGCEPCTQDCKKLRVVKCIRPVGHGEQEADVIADGYCQGPKPKESEIGICRTRRAHDDWSKMEVNEIENLPGPRSQRESLPLHNKSSGKSVLLEHRDTRTSLSKSKTDKNKIKNSDEKSSTIQDHPKNMDKGIQKDQIMIDKEDIKNFTLTILIERDEDNKIINFPKDFEPQPPENSTEFVLVGMDAIKYIQNIQNAVLLADKSP